MQEDEGVIGEEGKVWRRDKRNVIKYCPKEEQATRKRKREQRR